MKGCMNIINCDHTCGLSHRRTGGGGGSCPPKKITKSKSRANVQHKSGEEWETKVVGQYSLNSRAILAYYKKNWDKLCKFCG